jgi:hypothetical protein
MADPQCRVGPAFKEYAPFFRMFSAYLGNLVSPPPHNVRSRRGDESAEGFFLACAMSWPGSCPGALAGTA